MCVSVCVCVCERERILDVKAKECFWELSQEGCCSGQDGMTIKQERRSGDRVPCEGWMVGGSDGSNQHAYGKPSAETGLDGGRKQPFSCCQH